MPQAVAGIHHMAEAQSPGRAAGFADSRGHPQNFWTGLEGVDLLNSKILINTRLPVADHTEDSGREP